ncbi:restriction endonuclease subunit S [bacterium]|nr:restriction endonuclease subunit S [bacterium]
MSFVKNFSDAKRSSRIDAEYFQPKYDEIVDAVKNYKGGWDTLGDLVKMKKCVEPGSDIYQESGIPFVRVSNLSKFEITDNNQQYISEKLYQELIEHQPEQNEILLSKDATPGIAYHLKDKPGRMICSGGILRLTVKNRRRISTEYLTLVLNSTIVQQQILRDAGGSIINHWRLDQIRNTVVPILSEESQREIQSNIELAFNQAKYSRHLLEIAKLGVEMAIEQDEKTAEEWINQNIPLAIERGEHLT